jgi:hypothetical protein
MKTANNHLYKFNWNKNGKSFQWAIDNKEQVDGMEDYLDSSFAYLEFDLDYGSTPTWQEALDGELFEPAYHMLEGSIDYYINGRYNWDPDKIRCQYVPGYYDPYNHGDIITIDGVDYRYISSLSCSHEMEHQAENGDLVYDYRGSSFIRVLDPETDKPYPNA